MNVTLYRVQAFSRSVDAGSEAGVVLDAGQLSAATCQSLAASAAAITTAFCSAEGDDLRIRFFTPRAPSSVCMHAMVAAAHLLRERGALGPGAAALVHAQHDDYRLTVAVDGLVRVALPAPTAGTPIAAREAVAAALGMRVDDQGPGPIRVAGAGKPKLVVPVRTLRALLTLRPSEDAIRDVCVAQRAEGMFIFAREASVAGAGYHARHFNPLTLDAEDPICGIGTGALGAYLLENGEIRTGTIVVEQGHSTGRPGLVYLTIDDGLTVGGYAATRGAERLGFDPE